VPALQVQSPEFELQSHQKQTNKKLTAYLFSFIDVIFILLLKSELFAQLYTKELGSSMSCSMIHKLRVPLKGFSTWIL
jgi:hypothetical protein